MKVLIINGSPRLNGNSSTLINEMKKIFKGAIMKTNLRRAFNFLLEMKSICQKKVKMSLTKKKTYS